MKEELIKRKLEYLQIYYDAEGNERFWDVEAKVRHWLEPCEKRTGYVIFVRGVRVGGAIHFRDDPYPEGDLYESDKHWWTFGLFTEDNDEAEYGRGDAYTTFSSWEELARAVYREYVEGREDLE